MKCNIYGALMVLAFAVIISTAPMAQAQARARAQVPFDFSLDQKAMPAGAYEISSLNDRVLVVRNLDTREARLVIAPMKVEAPFASASPHAKLVFRKYDDEYFLAEIWNGSDIGIAFPECNREKELKLAGNIATSPEVVVVAMK